MRGRRPRRAPAPQPARRVEAPADPARGAARRGARRRQAPRLPARARAAQRGRRVARRTTGSSGPSASTRSRTTWRRTHDHRSPDRRRRPARAALRARRSPTRSRGSGARSPSRASSRSGSSARSRGRPRSARRSRSSGQRVTDHRARTAAPDRVDLGRRALRVRARATSPRGCACASPTCSTTRHGPAAQHAAGWETYLDRLDALLAGHPIDEIEAHVPIAELHEQYAVAFGQDPAPGRRMIASLPVPRPHARGRARAPPGTALPPSGRARVARDRRRRRAGALVPRRRSRSR